MDDARRVAEVILQNQKGRSAISVIRAAVVLGKVDWARRAAKSVSWDSLPGAEESRRALLGASAHALVGNTEEALDYLGKAAVAGYVWSPHIWPDPDMKSVRDHPRFKALRAKHSVGR